MHKKIPRILSVLALGLIPLAHANDIEPSKEFYTATKAGGPVTVDGVLSEWGGVPVLSDPKFAVPIGSGTSGTYVLFEPYGGGTWSGPDDQTSAVQVVYDQDNVYFGFVVTDDYHENSALSAWNGDSVQLMIANGNRTAQVALYNYALGGVEDALGDTIIMHEAGPAADAGCGCDTEAVVTRDTVKKKTYYEIKLPAASIGLATPLTAGMKFGLGMAINDGDDGAGQNGQKGWGGLGAHALVINGKTPSETALITLGTNGPGTDAPFLSAIDPEIGTFSFRANDKGASIVDPTSVKLTINGQSVTLTSSPKVGDATDFKYTATIPFAPNSTNSYTIEVKDTNGVKTTESGTFKTPAYAVLVSADKVTPDTTKPGFTWRVHQNNLFTENSIARAMAQLAGALGDNLADPNSTGPALAAGTPEANNQLPIDFDIESVINLSQVGGDANGEFTPDDQMPGIPGLGEAGQTDGIAAEITTYVQLKAGLNTLIVNSDDGFRTLVGNVNDVFLAKTAGQFDDLGGRGATDTSYSIYAPEAGFYAMRTIYQEGGGGANIEWKYVNSDGTHVLLNDVANGGPQTYRAVTSPVKTSIRAVVPAQNAAGVAPDVQYKVVLQEGSDAVDLSSVKLSVNGTATGAAAARSGNLINLSYQQTPNLPSGSTNKATLVYSAGGILRTQDWQFVAVKYVTLTPDLKVTGDTTKPGFIFKVHQNPNDTGTDLSRPIQQLAGLLGQNFADPSAQGIAIAPVTALADTNAPLTFEIDTVINMSQIGGDSNGEFTPDDQMPGIPSLSDTAPTDGIAAEITTYVELPAGKVTMIVNSDDGFRTTTGNINDILDAQTLGEFNGGRGAADTAYTFFVQQAGTYPLRTIWMEGGGGANIEWKMVKSDGTRVLLNDVANGGPKAYRATTTGLTAPSIISVSPVNGYTKANPTLPIDVTIQENGTAIDNGSLTLAIDGSNVTPTITRSGSKVTVHYQVTSPLSVGTHTNKLEFVAGGNHRIAQWSFTVPPVILDKIHSYPAQLLGPVIISPDKGGHTGAVGDTAIDLGTTGQPSVLIPDASFVNATTADDAMTFSIWVKKYDNGNSSAFWADSPSSPQAQRGFQAHIPWSDGNLYFDTAGCCAADDTRISAAITTFPGYTDATWWNDWHHFVYVKNGSSKQIWIDGELFLDGGAATALPTDFARIWLGAEGGGPDKGIANNMHGLIDDFAIFGTGLAQADIQALFNGTAPSALSASTKPLAYWDFNTTQSTGERPTISASRAGGVITLSWPSTATGFKLRFSSTVKGTYTDVPGVTGNSYQVTNPTGAGFYILQK